MADEHYVVTIEVKHVTSRTHTAVAGDAARLIHDEARVVVSGPTKHDALVQARQHLEIMQRAAEPTRAVNPESLQEAAERVDRAQRDRDRGFRS